MAMNFTEQISIMYNAGIIMCAFKILNCLKTYAIPK
jgi:hypothetical protein